MLERWCWWHHWGVGHVSVANWIIKCGFRGYLRGVLMLNTELYCYKSIEVLRCIFWWLALLRLTIGHARQSYRSICYLDGFVYAGCITCHISIWGWIFAFVVVIAEIRHLERCVTWEVYPLLDSVSLISHIEGIVKGVRGIGISPPNDDLILGCLSLDAQVICSV